MSKSIDNKSIETLVVDLVQGVVDVNELNLARANQRAAFLQALTERSALLTKVSKTNAEHFLGLAIKENPNYFVQLKRDQYSNELAQIYLFGRLTEAEGKNAPASPILVRKSLDEKTVFTYSYSTAEGDELYYLDKELQVPVSLKSNAIITLKLDDAVKFIDKLDIHITQLGPQKIKSVISDVIANHYKSFLNSYLCTNGIGYYTLCTSLNSVEDGFKSYIGDVFKPYGISVSEFVIKNIAIPKDIQFKLEDQAFKIRQRRADVAADAEFAKVSLESYEAKLAVQQKYPEAEMTLTEYEKDLALKRYLTKVGRKTDESVDRTIRIAQSSLKADKTVEKRDDIIPDIPTKPNIFRRFFITFAFILTFVSIIVLTNNTGAGFIVLGASILLLGLIAALNTEKFATIKVEPSIADNPIEASAPAVTDKEVME